MTAANADWRILFMYYLPSFTKGTTSERKCKTRMKREEYVQLLELCIVSLLTVDTGEKINYWVAR